MRTNSLPRRTLRVLAREHTEAITPKAFAAAGLWRQVRYILARQDPFYGGPAPTSAPADPLIAYWNGEITNPGTTGDDTLVCCVDANNPLRGIALLLDETQVDALGAMLLEPDAPNDWPEPALNTPVETTGDLLASGRIEGEALITGTVIRLDQRINKAGNQWAIVTVDDGTGTLEIQFFPRTWQQVHRYLRLDEEFTVSGQINERNGKVSLFGAFAVQPL